MTTTEATTPEGEGAAAPFRLLPKLDDTNRHFWTGGAAGELRFLRCQACGWWIHPPAPVCPACLSRDLAVEAVSGRGVVYAVTVNHHPWYPGFEPPYAVVIVALPEQAGLRLTTNVIGCAADDVRIGMDVKVVFERHDDVWLPLFEPADG